jgi:short-subunit dehydrogenase
MGEIDMSATNSQRTALITGASSGIGAVYASRLARRAFCAI